MNEKTFKKLVWRKMVENIISVKVWVIFTIILVSSIMVFMGFMSAPIFASMNGGIISTVFAMREVFKVAKIKQVSEEEAKDMAV